MKEIGHQEIIGRIHLIVKFCLNPGKMKRYSSKTHHKNSASTKIRVIKENSKDKLIRSAEELFSTKRYREASILDIAAQAGVNFGLVPYYFGGKQALFDGIFHSHVAPLVEERIKLLKVVTHNDRTSSVEEILRAWILPCIQQGDKKRQNSSSSHHR